MRHLQILTICLLVLTFGAFLFNGCNEDDKKDDEETNLTQAQADAAIQNPANAATIAALATLVSSQARDAAAGDLANLDTDADDLFESLNFFLFFKPGTKNLGKKMGEVASPMGSEGFTYDGLGCWSITIDTTETDPNEEISLTYDSQLCFDAYNEIGFPTPNTNTMDYVVDFDITASSTDEDGTLTISLSTGTDINVTGITGYNAETGNLVVNGSGDQSIGIAFISTQGTQSLSLSYDHTVNNVTFTPTGAYPASGNIQFTISQNATPPIPDFPNYTVSGTITFDGTAIVGLTFAGYAYSLDLDYGEIY